MRYYMATRGKKKPGKNRRRKKKQDLTLKLGIGMAVVIVLLAGGLTAVSYTHLCPAAGDIVCGTGGKGGKGF